MSLTKRGYMPRLIDEKVARYLRVFGAVSLEGPKWCGKTWTSLNHARSATYLTEKSSRDLANARLDVQLQDERRTAARGKDVRIKQGCGI